MNTESISRELCPICAGIRAERDVKHTLISPEDIIYDNGRIVALINSFFIPTCEGHVIIVPVDHYETIYDLPDSLGAEIFIASRKIATAMRRIYPGCKGITIRQNNEYAGDQHAPHYHLHIIPRYNNDTYNDTKTAGVRQPADIAERVRYASLFQQNNLDFTRQDRR